MPRVARQDTVKKARQRPTFKIGAVAKHSGIGIEALRFYERSGLLESPSRTESGYRVYDAAVLERLAFIKQAQTLGFSLNEIKRIIDDARAGKSPCDEVRALVRQRLAELDTRLREMRRYRTALATTLAEWDRLGQAPGHICGLIEGTHFEPSGNETMPVSTAQTRQRTTRGRLQRAPE
jgi:DNA-binding transcriptional MerR regulator